MYKRVSGSWSKHLDFILYDMGGLLLTFYLSYGIRNGFGFANFDRTYVNAAIVLVFIDAFITFFNESYKGIVRRGHWQEFRATIKQVTWIMGMMAFYLFITQDGVIYSRMVFVMHWFSGILLLYAVREIWKLHLRRKGICGEGRRSILLITSKTIAAEVVRTVQENMYGQIRLSGIILSDEKSQRDAIEGTSVVAIGREEALYYLQKNWVDEVLIHLPEDEEASKEVIAMCTKMGITVHLTLTRVLNAERQVIEKLGGYTVLSTSINMATTKQLFAKRALDIVGGVVGVFFTGIFFLFVAPLIFIQSPGPIFFGQERVGRNGKHFKLYKFRSMYLDAEARKAELLAQNEMGSELMFKIENDPRIIGGSRGIGNFIRKTSIDEFPQFFNVLKGNMSLVGTRPPTVDEWNQYEMHHRKRLSAKPGITGMWQVSGRSSITDFEEVVKLDTQYIENWSFGMDLKILAKTVEVVLGKDGAA